MQTLAFLQNSRPNAPKNEPIFTGTNRRAEPGHRPQPWTLDFAPRPFAKTKNGAPVRAPLIFEKLMSD
jgi:hypothetical protein